MAAQQPIQIVLTNNLQLSLVPLDFRSLLMEKLTFPNPKWLENTGWGAGTEGLPGTSIFMIQPAKTVYGSPGVISAI
jgi:hypothetical protein